MTLLCDAAHFDYLILQICEAILLSSSFENNKFLFCLSVLIPRNEKELHRTLLVYDIPLGHYYSESW